jgi:hypothetical protein
VRPFGGDVMDTTLLSTINVMNFNNIGGVRSAARKAYGPSSDFLFTNFPISKSFSDYINSEAERKVNDFMERYNDSSSELNQISQDLKQLFVNTYTNKEVRVDTETLQAVAKQDAMVKEYDFTVEQLATIQQDTSNAVDSQASNLTEFGTSEITIQQGEASHTLSVDTENAENNQDVLKKIASSINQSDAKISAKVLTDDAGNSRLSVESSETGTDFSYDIEGDIPAFIDIKSISTSKNARFTVDGQSFETSSNIVSLDQGQLEVTLKEETDDTQVLSVQVDTEPVESQLSSLADQLQDMDNFLSDYSKDSRLVAKYERRLTGLINQFENDLNDIGIVKDDKGNINFSKDVFDENFESKGTEIIKELDQAGGFIDRLNKFSVDLSSQDIQTLAPESSSNNLPTFMQDDFINYLSMSRGFDIHAFYPTGGILDFML